MRAASDTARYFWEIYPRGTLATSVLTGTKRMLGRWAASHTPVNRLKPKTEPRSLPRLSRLAEWVPPGRGAAKKPRCVIHFTFDGQQTGLICRNYPRNASGDRQSIRLSHARSF